MFDDLAATFHHNVVAAYDEYVAQRDIKSAGRDRHLRTAVAAAVALYHFREHLPAGLRTPLRNLEQTSQDYELMRGVTNASKHKEASRGQPLVARAEDIREVIVIVRYSDGGGEYSHAQTVIRVACTDGATRWLDPAITRIFNYWGMFLKDADICGFIPRPEPYAPGDCYVIRSKASTRLDLEALRGLDFRQSVELLKFDNTLGRAVPVDLTGANLQLRVYRPPQHMVDITLSHPDRTDVAVSISLSEQENAAFHRIENEADHDAFMKNLYQTHRSEIELMLGQRLAESHGAKEPH
jgi:hypothetical protein